VVLGLTASLFQGTAASPSFCLSSAIAREASASPPTKDHNTKRRPPLLVRAGSGCVFGRQRYSVRPCSPCRPPQLHLCEVKALQHRGQGAFHTDFLRCWRLPVCAVSVCVYSAARSGSAGVVCLSLCCGCRIISRIVS
jgi:hypothetical protein